MKKWLKEIKNISSIILYNNNNKKHMSEFMYKNIKKSEFKIK